MASQDVWISPKHQASYLDGSVERKVDVVEARMEGWIFAPAQLLVDQGGQHAGLAILMLLAAYFETLGAWLSGKPSKGWEGGCFELGFRGVYETLDKALLSQGATNPAAVKEIARLLFKDLRCGLYHESMTRQGVLISRNMPGSMIFSFDSGAGSPQMVTANPWNLLGVSRGHCNGYMATLRDPAQKAARANFDQVFR